MSRVRSHAKPAKTEIADIDEFTFRFFVLAEIKRRYPDAICQPEWNGIDLVVTTSTGRTIAIEFKFYVLRKTYPLDAKSDAKPHWKGGAGANNRRNFDTCVRKLSALRHKGIDEKYLVLVYDRRKHGRKTSFEDSYCDSKLKEQYEQYGVDARTIENCWGDHVACKLIQVD